MSNYSTDSLNHKAMMMVLEAMEGTITGEMDIQTAATVANNAKALTELIKAETANKSINLRAAEVKLKVLEHADKIGMTPTGALKAIGFTNGAQNEEG